ncbi:fumarylacetoacetate hydrolase family protein [Marivita sp. GX14005]|uniref:fumarylacetoacetate hydrolase family protein n=1 Tax=Marivita sp. GX14005 TaxID=2942276 RepID=UPI0020187D0A|nr:fumarylacetoacetate hydrolase family protein [Marivita sp. GX14005]MCL3880779.1 fumarylacetoacetate hydrolase family protein [Marivita sp. GX14005]
MKFLVGDLDGKRSVFAVRGDGAVDLCAIDPRVGQDLMALIRDDGLRASVLERAAQAETVPVDRIAPALPLADPGKIMCLGLNYADHAKEAGMEVPDYPTVFMRSRTSLVPSGTPFVRPACSDALDYEAELMIVIGRGGRHIAEEDALGHVFGYTTFNDATLRDFQNKTQQWTPGKNFDATGAVGPYVVSADALPAGASGLAISCRVNGETLQSSNTDEMICPVARTVAILSEFTTLEPGDLIATGTPSGVGMAHRPEPRWLRPGDHVEVEIERIGTCVNPVIAEGTG